MDFNLHPPPVHSQAKDFNVYAGDDDSSFTCMPPNGYFASQALRAGICERTAMPRLPLPLPDHNKIGREIMKERIREEILAGEMAERKILENEVRRELEIERIMKMRRMERPRFSLLAGTIDTVKNQMTQSFFPSYPQARSGASRYFARDAAEFTFRERSPSHLRQKEPMVVVEESFLHHNSEFLPSEQNKTSNFMLSGTKRKTREESQLPVKKQWGCALCEVNTTCENSLKAHLEGKKHKAKEALLASKNISRKEPLLTKKKNGTLPLNDTSASGLKNKEPLVKGASALQTKGTSASGPKNKKQTLVKGASTLPTKDTSSSGPKNKKQPRLKGASGGGPRKRFWCSVCRVKCNSENMLEFHRAGKKHKIFLELKKDGIGFGIKNPSDIEAGGFVKKVAEAGAEGLAEGELSTGDLAGRNGVDGDGIQPLENVLCATAAARS